MNDPYTTKDKWGLAMTLFIAALWFSAISFCMLHGVPV